jgi:hypothetical protein
VQIGVKSTLGDGVVSAMTLFVGNKTPGTLAFRYSVTRCALVLSSVRACVRVTPMTHHDSNDVVFNETSASLSLAPMAQSQVSIGM